MTSTADCQSSPETALDRASNLTTRIDSIRIRGFRSLTDVEIPLLPKATVLVGPNGAGKSNIFKFLQMVQQMLRHRRLNEFVQSNGGADDQLHHGHAKTAQIKAQFSMHQAGVSSEYRFALNYAEDDSLRFSEEAFRTSQDGQPLHTVELQDPATGNRESMAPNPRSSAPPASWTS